MQLCDQQLALVGGRLLEDLHGQRALNENSHATFPAAGFRDTGHLPALPLHRVRHGGKRCSRDVAFLQNERLNICIASLLQEVQAVTVPGRHIVRPHPQRQRSRQGGFADPHSTQAASGEPGSASYA